MTKTVLITKLKQADVKIKDLEDRLSKVNSQLDLRDGDIESIEYKLKSKEEEYANVIEEAALLRRIMDATLDLISDR